MFLKDSLEIPFTPVQSLAQTNLKSKKIHTKWIFFDLAPRR